MPWGFLTISSWFGEETRIPQDYVRPNYLLNHIKYIRITSIV